MTRMKKVVLLLLIVTSVLVVPPLTSAYGQERVESTNKVTSLILFFQIYRIFILHVAYLSHSELYDHITNFNCNTFQLSSELLIDIEIHGLLLWASMGFLMPLSILAIRMSNRQESGGKFKFMFYMHATLQASSKFLFFQVLISRLGWWFSIS